MEPITIVGGGIAGLVAAIEAAEAGAAVHLHEARSRLGGRAITAPGEYAANLGPHALYTGGSLWAWLQARGLDQPARKPRPTRVRLRWQGEIRRTPPASVLSVRRLYAEEAPVDQSFRDWATGRAGAEATDALCGAAGVLTFDADPGRLSAAFVWPRLRRFLLTPNPPARYVIGGWGRLIDRMAGHARSLGAVIECGSPVDRIDDPERTIVAVSPGGARRLLGDDDLRPECPTVALLDLGLVARRGDPYLVSDLDEGAFVDRFTHVDPTLAPPGHSLVQASIGMRPGEALDDAVARIEAIVDAAFTGWRDRTTWRRRSAVREATGAVDLPGTTWRDRTPIRHPSGVLLAGDWVAAPGHLAEVSCASAVDAARLARSPLPVRSPGS